MSPGRGARLWRTLVRIRTRLLLINLLIVAVPIVGMGFARTFERELLRGLEEDMIHQAEVLRAVLLADPAGLLLDERAPMLIAAARHTRARIRLLGPGGTVRADSHDDGPPEGPEPAPPQILPDFSSLERSAARHAGDEGMVVTVSTPPPVVQVHERTEVLRALAGHYGSMTRLWENGNRLFLFSALPIQRDGEVHGVIYVTRSTNPVRASLYRLRTSLIWVLIAALGSTLVLTLFLAGTISRPLARLTKIAGRIAAGDRSKRLALNRPDEIGELARAFDIMARELDSRAQDVAQLAANLSHEFKSPLTAIRGAAELLSEGAADDAEARERFLGNILADTRRLDRLVTRLLELSRLQADHAPRELVDYEALVHAVAERAGPNPVEVHFNASRTYLSGRHPHLLSVLQNLVDNAQQHAAPGSTIAVRVADGPAGFIRTAVHNHGSAISEGNLNRIWDRFFTTRADQGGTGLGLPIVVAVVEAHGGTVSVTSVEGKGTTFSFDLPCVSPRG